MLKKKPLILLTNDDGIYAPGIFALYKEMEKIGRVIVVAPSGEQSAVGHAITLTDPLRVTKAVRRGKLFGYAVSGTPADCVKIALVSILKEKPDLVVSGINLGPNLGINVIYSGTVSAATEGTMFDIPSIAMSLGTFEDPDFSVAAKFARKLSCIVLKKKLPKGVLLNVNVPAISEKKIKGIKITHQSKITFKEKFEKRIDPRKRTYYWMAGSVKPPRESSDADFQAVKEGYISITPVHYDMTAYEELENLRSWKL
ncbi:MAG: 5'/3'-nucleotidase SurE [Candidatus Saganbacteria bacterium]|nr:5'/3'-nucleotidase SurE [Candidatus Saganbacteria bacterium]